MARIQETRQLAVATPLGEDVLLLRRFSGSETLGRLFTYELEFFSETADINFDDIVGQNVTVRVQQSASDEPRYFNGFLSSFEHVRSELGVTRYRATMVPWLWFLTLQSDCRIFQEMTVPDIIKQVFRERGLTDFEDRLSGTYRTWTYCVQYRETDFNFVSRLMEQEGIYYYFIHQNGKHVLVLSDDRSAHDAAAGYDEILFRPPTDSLRTAEHVWELFVRRQVQPCMFAHNDFDFKNPKKDLQTKAQIPRNQAAPDSEIYDYPGEYVEYGDGESYARTRIEEIQADFELFTGETDARGVTTGYTFTLTGNPRDDLNRKYLVISTAISAESDEFGSGSVSGENYVCTFTAIDAEEAFRSARTTPKPLIRGPQTAIVVGPSGEEIYTDEYGRVKLQFHWDRYSAADENSSCWVRVSQGWAGKKWGAIYIPRIGHEVIVEFEEGDPDRPIITGRVYNGEEMPPYELPANATMSTLKSNSSKGGGGFNEVRFEDKKGEEQIFIHAEKNADTRVKNDCFEWIGNKRHLIVKKDQLEHVENNRHELVDMDHMEEIGKDRHLKIKGKEAKEVAQSHSFKVTGDVIEEFMSNHSEQVTMNYYLKAMQIVIEAMTGITLKCGGSSVVVDMSGVTVSGPKVVVTGGLVNINSGPGSSPGSGSPGSLVSPTAPEEAEEADSADPGEVAEAKARQRETQTGKYGSVQVTPFKPPETEEEAQQRQHWIAIKLVDEEDNPVPGEKYKITLPDGQVVAEGTLDEKGEARVDGIQDPGNCKVTFPELDGEAWERA